MIQKIYRLGRFATKKFQHDNITAFSAQAAFFTLLSIFPFLMFLLTMIQYLPFTETTLLTYVNELFPSAISNFFITIITEIYTKSTGTLVSITAMTALWSSSRGFYALTRGLNAAYDIDETRNYFVIRFWSFLYTLLFAIALMVIIGLLVFGNSIFSWLSASFPELYRFALPIVVGRVLVSFLLMLFLFTMFYTFIPNRKSRFVDELPGALAASIGWIGFSYLYSYYIEHFSNYSRMYGSLTAIVLFMLWLYFCMNMLLAGAELNHIRFKFKEWKSKHL